MTEPSFFVGTDVEEPFPGVQRTAMTTAHVTVARYRFEPESAFPVHAHRQEQITIVDQGTIRFTVNEVETTMSAGEFAVTAPEVPHGIVAGGDGGAITVVLSPARSPDDAASLPGWHQSRSSPTSSA